MMPGCFDRTSSHQLGGTPRFVALEILRAVVPPENVHRPVVGDEFIDLLVEVGLILGVIALAVRVRLAFERVRQLLRLGVGVLVVVPVDDGVVEADFQTFGPARLDDFLHEVAVQYVPGVVVAGFRVEQAEAVVVFGGEDEILAAGFLGEPGPLAGEVGGRLELRDRLPGVGVGVGFDALLDPLHAAALADRLAVPRAGQAGVETPMDKHAEACFTPPLHAGIPLLRRFRQRGWRRNCRSA